jgi:hypothetical protein
MIHNDIQNQLALLVKTSAPPLLEVAQSPTETPQWTLELTFITSSPRLTFALTQDMEQALPANSGVSLSETAKFLGALLQRGADEQGKPAAVTNSVPILNGSPGATQDFAAALRTAVSQSGLFYESHQAQWVSGERNLATLLQEPQAQLPVLDVRLPSAPEALAAGKGGGEAVQALQTGVPGDNDAVSALPRDPVHPQALPLVHQQLEALDTRQILWQGQVWPGQDMDWQIEEDGARRSAADEEAVRWRTRLHLELPSLGGVTARLAIVDKGIRIEMTANRGSGVSALRSDTARLLASMEATGLRVDSLVVREDERG